MENSSPIIGFYIRGETPRTLAHQHYLLRQFSKDYNILIEEIVVIKDVARSNDSRPQLEQIINGQVKVDILAMHSAHILHLYSEESEQLMKLLHQRGVSLLFINLNKGNE
ncbi:recombinase family protein [Cohnella terricola]|uniref:Recombinase family protein n=1 Tax=Cohnella terricola TaxID=1289167 RepID=A0A559JDK2_9BACL|nr:recombinase family protein [Cohnella terricola]TVX97949.1 recombinase family protein [Cohnella terricola]